MAIYYAAPPVGDVASGYTAGNDANSGTSSSSPKTITGILASMTSGDTLKLIPGIYRANRNYTSTTGTPTGALTAVAAGSGQLSVDFNVAGITVEPLNAVTPSSVSAEKHLSGNAWSAHWTHDVIIEMPRVGANDVTIRGLEMVCPYWPTKTGRWQDTPIGNTMFRHGGVVGILDVYGQRCLIDQCNLHGGDGIALDPLLYPSGYGGALVPYDTDIAKRDCERSLTWFKSSGDAWTLGLDPERWDSGTSSNTAGLGDARNGIDPDGRAAAFAATSGYNPFIYAPRLIYGHRYGNGAGGLRVTRSSGHSCRSVMEAISYNTTDPAVVDQCHFERIYIDGVFLGNNEQDANSPTYWQVSRTAIQEPFGDQKQLGGSHCDAIQILRGGANLGKNFQDGLRLFNNCIYQTTAQRVDVGEGGQGLWIGNNGTGQKNGDVNIVRYPIFWNILTTMRSYFGVTTKLVKTASLRNFVAVSRAINGVSAESGQVATPQIRLTGLSPSLSGVSAEAAGLSEIYKCITDGQLGYTTDGTPVEWINRGLKTLGKQGESTSYPTVFKGGNGSGDFSGHASWAAREMWEAFRSKNAATDGGYDISFEAAMENTFDWAAQPTFIGWQTQRNVTASSTVTFTDATIFGGGAPGASATITPGSGVEVQVKTRTGTVVTAWTTSPVTAKRMEETVEIRGTSSATAGLSKSFPVTIDGQSFAAQAVTASGNGLPRATFDGTTNKIRYASATGGMAADGKYLTAFIMFVPDAAQMGVARDLFAVTTGAAGPLRIFLTATNLFGFSSRNIGGTAVVNAPSFGTAVTAGTPCGIALSIDTTQASFVDGVKVYTIDSNFTWTQRTVAGASMTTNADLAFSYHSASVHWNIMGAQSTFTKGDFMACWMTNQWVDLSDPAIQQAFTADGIGYDGDGVIDGQEPLVFHVGKASLINADTKLGTNPLTLSHLGTVTAGSPDIWPVPLTLISSVISVAPYRVGTPIDILVYPVQSANIPLNVTASVSGVTGTWESNPKAMPEASNGIVFTFTPTSAGAAIFNFADDATPDYTNPEALSVTVAAAPVAARSSGMSLSLGFGL